MSGTPREGLFRRLMQVFPPRPRGPNDAARPPSRQRLRAPRVNGPGDTLSSMIRLAAAVAFASLFLAPVPRALAQATTNPAATPPPPAPSTAADAPPRDNTQRWWNDRVFYEIFVRSFADSAAGPLAGDGVGDLRGIIERLDYLNDGDPATATDLGITGLWLMPISPSPSYHGYDVTDYKDVDPEYGTLEDFKELLAACHARGIAVVIDFVANHCSKEHPWFVEAADPASPTHDWFIWSDSNPGWKGPWNQTVWHPLARRAGGGGGENRHPYYYGIFSSHMPDLNYRSEGATAAIIDAMNFWGNEIKVDGLRLDAIRHLIETDRVQESTSETHDWLRTRFFPASKAIGKDFMTVGEVWADSRQASSYVGDQMDLVFEFALADAMLAGAREGNAAKVNAALAEVERCYPLNQFGSFLTNHDQGRVANQLKMKDGPMRAAAAMLLLGPGIPFLYYGEEIGMTGDKPDELIRTPMQWSAARNAGFSTTPAWQAPNKGFESLNVAAQTIGEGSLLSHYRRLIALRNANVHLRRGDVRPIVSSNPGVFACMRRADAGQGADTTAGVLVLVNFSDRAVTDYQLSGSADWVGGVSTARDTLTGVAADAPAADTSGTFTNYSPVRTLPPHSYAVIEFR